MDQTPFSPNVTIFCPLSIENVLREPNPILARIKERALLTGPSFNEKNLPYRSRYRRLKPPFPSGRQHRRPPHKRSRHCRPDHPSTQRHRPRRNFRSLDPIPQRPSASTFSTKPISAKSIPPYSNSSMPKKPLKPFSNIIERHNPPCPSELCKTPHAPHAPLLLHRLLAQSLSR